jgi:hypothetical protein
MSLSVSGRSLNVPWLPVKPGGQISFFAPRDADLCNIGSYALRTWGEARTDSYIRKIEECCQLLAGSPALGHPAQVAR